MAPWINDEFKVNDQPDADARPALRLPVRAHRERAISIRRSIRTRRIPAAGGLPGALIFAGEGAGRSGQRTFENPARDAWGPRVGFAYRLSDKHAIRGGYGIYYAGVAFDQFIGLPTLGFAVEPAGAEHDQRPVTRVLSGRGVPAATGSTQPPFIDPTFANGGNVLAVPPDGLTLPRFQNWSVTFQRQLTDNMMLDVSYIGNRGSRLNHHAQTLGVDANMNDPTRARAGRRRCCSRTSTRPLARQAGIHVALPGLQRQRRAGAAAVSRSTRPSSGAACRPASSQYHAIEIVLERRFSRGLQARFGYTYSQLNNNGAESAQGARRRQRRRAESGRPARLGAQRRRHAARVPHRLHVGDARARRWTSAVDEGCCWRAGTSAASCGTRAAGR